MLDESIINNFSKLKYLEYEEIKKLLSVKPKKELIECVITKGIIKQEEAIDYDVNYFRCNYGRCEKVQEIDYVKYKPNLINDEHREVEIVEIIDDSKVEFCKIINDNKVEFCEIIEDRKAKYCKLIERAIESYELIKEETIKSNEIIEEEIIEFLELIKDKDCINKLIEDKNDVHQLIKEIIEPCELIEDQEDINKLIAYCELNKEETIDDQKGKNCEIIDEIIKDKKITTYRPQKVENINMLKSSRNEFNKIKELGLTMKELKATARKRGVKNYENLSRIRLVEEIDKTEPKEELKKKKIVSSLLSKGKKVLD